MGESILKQYKINTGTELYEWYKKIKKENPDYPKAMYRLFNSMKPGDRFVIMHKIPAKKWEIFIKTACLCMILSSIDDVEFDEEYKCLIKKDAHEKTK